MRPNRRFLNARRRKRGKFDTTRGVGVTRSNRRPWSHRLSYSKSRGSCRASLSKTRYGNHYRIFGHAVGYPRFGYSNSHINAYFNR